MAPSDLSALAKCFCFDQETAKRVIVYLLAKNANVLAMTAAQLADAAKCYCYNDDFWKRVVVYLLSNTSGGGGATCVTGGNTPPVGVPPCAFSLWIQGPGPNRGVWFGDLSGWDAIPLIAQGP